MVFEIDGTDVTPYINFEGLKYTTFDLDSEETTRTLDGNLRRSRIATKVRWDVPCKLLRTTEVETLMQLLKPEWVQLRASDPVFGLRTGTFYSNNNSISMKITSKTSEEDELWEGLTFPLIER